MKDTKEEKMIRKMFMMSTRKRDRIRKQMRGNRSWDPFTLSIHSCDDQDRHTDLFLIFHFHFCLLLTLTYFHSFRASIDKKNNPVPYLATHLVFFHLLLSQPTLSTQPIQSHMILTFAKPALLAPCDSMYSMYLGKSLNSSQVGRNTIILG